MTDLPARLREWGAADMDTHAVLKRHGVGVADVPLIDNAVALICATRQAADHIEAQAAEIARLQVIITGTGHDPHRVATRLLEGRATAPDPRLLEDAVSTILQLRQKLHVAETRLDRIAPDGLAGRGA